MIENKQANTPLMPKVTIDVERVHKYDSDRKNRKKIYHEGWLIPAIIYRTEPLTIVAMASLCSDVVYAPKKRFGCQEFEIGELPGQIIRTGEPVPCACFCITSDNPAYYSQFIARPLCWATGDRSEIQDNIDMISERYPGIWAIMDGLAGKLLFNDVNMLNILDEFYRPLILRNADGESGGEYQLTQESKRKYRKWYDGLPVVQAPHRDIANMIKLAYRNQVAEYFLGFIGHKNRGYTTLFSNPETSEAFIREINPHLQNDEVVLVAAHAIITNKGVWDKKGFTAWRDVHVYIWSLGKDVYTRFGEKDIEVFRLCYDYYPVEIDADERPGSLLRSLEIEHLTTFWLEMKQIIGEKTPFDFNSDLAEDIYENPVQDSPREFPEGEDWMTNRRLKKERKRGRDVNDA